MKPILDYQPLIFVKYLVQQFIRHQGILNAAALTYTTLFAVVPLMTVSYAMLATIPSFQGVGKKMQNLVFENFVPSTGTVIQDYLSNFSQQAQQLTGVGIALLAITSIMMMKNIEAAFNRVWQISEPRKGLSSFMLYWSVLSLGPVLIGLGMVLTSYVTSLSFITSATKVAGKAGLISLLPMLLSSAAFTLIYAAVPNCRVPFKSALIGGIVVAILFESAKRGFAAFVTHFPSYELVYGAFAVVPLFLLWIFISWVIILMGAELTRCITTYRADMTASENNGLHSILAILYLLWKAQKKGTALTDKQILRKVSSLNHGNWDSCIKLLQKESIVKCTNQEEYLISRDPSNLSLAELQAILPSAIPINIASAEKYPWESALNKLLATINNQQRQTLDISINELFSCDVPKTSD